MIDVVGIRSRSTAALFAIASALVAALVCGIASGSALSVVPAAFLVRFVWADYEGTMTIALMMMGGLALVALSISPAACLLALAGAFVAAELASLGAQIQRSGSDAQLRRRLFDVAGNILFGLAAMGFGATLTIAHLPVSVGIAALAVVSVGAVWTWISMSGRSAPAPEPVADARPVHPQGAQGADSGRTER
ncbi:MAG: hypothetical protein ABIR32_19500 [Ilumatobacteraceae bacterium]